LPWTEQPGPRPQRSEGELFEVVRERAAAIRRRRRAAVSAAVGGLAAVLIVAAGLARAGDDRASKLQVIGPEPTTSTSVVLPTVTELLPMPTSVVPAPTSTVRRTTTTTVRATPRTTVAPRPTTTAAPATTTSSTVPAPLRQCDAADVVVTATPDRTTYAVGAPVSIVVAALNRSSRACQPVDPHVEFRTGAGAVLFSIHVADAFTFYVVGEPVPSWDPGETLSLPFRNVILHCGDGTQPTPCPAGTYSATAVFGTFRSPPATFTLT
jgi:hypothetical protein